jgi:hypothetical protein
MAGQLPAQCRVHPGFVAGKCGACEIAKNPAAATAEKRINPAHAKHFGRTSQQSKEAREQYEADARARREEYARQEALAAMQGKAR